MVAVLHIIVLDRQFLGMSCLDPGIPPICASVRNHTILFPSDHEDGVIGAAQNMVVLNGDVAATAGLRTIV